MRILLISNMYPRNKISTFGIFIKNIEDGLVTNGVDVDRIVIEGRGKNLAEKARKYYAFYKAIFRVDFDKYDFIHLSYPSHTYPPIIFKKMNKAKLIIRLHGHDLIPIILFQKLVFYFTRLSILKADMVVTPSHYFYNELLKTAKPKDYYVYPSGGLDIQTFYPTKKEEANKLTIGYVGRIDDGKGIDVLLKAVAKLKFDFELIVVGGGQLEDEIKQQSTLLNKNQTITFTGKIPNKELVNYYNRFDVFVFPTLMYEAFGNVAIEAMGCKVPIIGSKIGGLTDYIYEGENGYFFEAGNADNLAEKITKFNGLSLDKKKVMSDNAHEVALKYEKNYQTQGFIKKLEELRRQN